MADLRTNYMGLELKSPVIAGASNLVTETDNLKDLEENGAGAIIYKSLFEEQVQLENLELYELKTEYEDRNWEQITLFPNSHSVPESPDDYLLNLKKARDTVTIPLIASLNAINDEVWVEYAVKAVGMGVDGLELNFYTLPDQPGEEGRYIEKKQIDTLKKVKAAVDIPVSVKLSPFYSNPVNFISALDRAGADAVVVFNRLMQLQNRDRVEALGHAAHELGGTLPDPLMTMSFLALAVIPELKITDRGLVDVSEFALVPLHHQGP